MNEHGIVGGNAGKRSYEIEQSFVVVTPFVNTGLNDVTITGVLDNTTSTFTIRQTYTNDTEEPIEALYTFPLPVRAVLLDMKAHFGQRTLQGAVQGSLEAKEQYEKAIEEGDAAILLDEVDTGLYHASFGNLKPGETATIEYR